MDHQQHPQPQQQRGEASSSSSSFSCRLLPHGGYTLIPATLSTMAWVASLAQDGCDYAKLTGPIVSEMTTSSSSSSSFPYLEVGFNAFRAPVLKSDGTWVVDYDSQCLQYDPLYVTMDNYWTAAKLAEFLSLVFGGGGALFLWFSSCFVFSPATWRWAGYEIATACVCQCASFVWFRTAMCRGDGDRCMLFFGSRSDIAAAVFWFVSAAAIFARYPTPGAPKDPSSGTRSGRAAPEVVSARDEEERWTEEGGGVGAGTVATADLELPVEGDASATLPPPIHDPGSKGPGDRDVEAEII